MADVQIISPDIPTMTLRRLKVGESHVAQLLRELIRGADMYFPNEPVQVRVGGYPSAAEMRWRPEIPDPVIVEREARAQRVSRGEAPFV